MTFASKGDLLNHWLCCIVLEYQPRLDLGCAAGPQFCRSRARCVLPMMMSSPRPKPPKWVRWKCAIPPRLKRCNNPQRNFTRLIFIDAVEPKNLAHAASARYHPAALSGYD